MIVALKLETISSYETLEQTFIILCNPLQSPLSKMSTVMEQVSKVVIQESILGP
jgi:hypothetical protein